MSCQSFIPIMKYGIDLPQTGVLGLPLYNHNYERVRTINIITTNTAKQTTAKDNTKYNHQQRPLTVSTQDKSTSHN